MKVRAKIECFASASIRHPNQEFDFEPYQGIIPDFLEVIDENAPMPEDDMETENDKYAALSDAQIREKLVNCMQKVPPRAGRKWLVTKLAEVEGKN